MVGFAQSVNQYHKKGHNALEKGSVTKNPAAVRYRSALHVLEAFESFSCLFAGKNGDDVVGFYRKPSIDPVVIKVHDGGADLMSGQGLQQRAVFAGRHGPK